MRNNIILLSLSSIICIIIIEYFSYKNIKSKLENAKVDKEVFEFYYSHYQTLHHLADKPNIKWKNNLLELLYREIGKGDNIILIQGDSWGLQFEIDKSKEMLFNISEKNNLKFIMAGNTSYSPSISTAQLTKLEEDFNILPNHIIISVDQSDIGDELCRYKDLRKKIDNKIIVQPEPVGGALVFGVKNHLEKYRILYSGGLNTHKLIKYKIFAYRLAKLYENYEVKCGGENILFKPLINGFSDEERNYLIKVIEDYINIAFSNEKLRKLFFVVHPHRRHLEGIYKENIADLVNEAIQNSNNSNLITMISPYDSIKNKDIPLDKIFVEGDVFSHLTDDYFLNHYFRNVFSTFFNESNF